MSLESSIKQQKDIEGLKSAIKNAFVKNMISDLILLDFPRWSLYYKDGTSSQSFDFNAIKAGVIHKYLREHFL